MGGAFPPPYSHHSPPPPHLTDCAPFIAMPSYGPPDKGLPPPFGLHLPKEKDSVTPLFKGGREFNINPSAIYIFESYNFFRAEIIS